MTTAPVRPVSPPGGQLTIRTAPSPRSGMAVGGRPTAQQLADIACRVVDTHPELLTSVEFGSTTFACDEGVTRSAGGVARAASREVTAAAGAVEQGRALTAGATPPPLEGYSEPLRRVEPVARRLGEVTQVGETDALATLFDRLPRPADATDHEVMPLLRHVDQLGPDLSQLLDSVSQLSHMASRLPKVFRRRNPPKP